MNRLQHRLQNLKYLRSESSHDSTELLPEFKNHYSLINGAELILEGRIHNDELTLLHFSVEKSFNPEVVALIDVWAEFALKRKNLNAIKNIRIPEIENYLRDHNDQYALTMELAKVETLFNWLLDFYRFFEKHLSENSLAPIENFNSLGLIRKIKHVEEILNKKIRHTLTLDGGNIELVDLKNEAITVKYIGSCSSCSSRKESTLDFITKTLRYYTINENLKIHVFE